MKKNLIIASVVIFALVVGAILVRKLDGSKEKIDSHVIEVGFLPVTCHLTCPVTDFATQTSKKYHFASKRFTDFPTVAESFKTGKLKATFFVAPLAMKLVEQGVPAKIVYLGHRDGSTVMVRKDDKAQSLKDLQGRRFAIPSRYSNQHLVIRKLMKDQNIPAESMEFVEMAPPDMPGALASKAIDAYFVGEPHAARAETNGTGRVLYHAKDIWPKFISCVLVVSQKLIDEQPEVVADLVRGIAESGEWAEVNRDKAAKLVAPYFKQDEKLIDYVLHQPPDRVSYKGLAPTNEEMENIHAMAIEVGILTKPMKVEDYLDRQFLPKELLPNENLEKL
ncbi:ABC transporter substrate-binding protein [Bdellovibrio sp. HCB337]|uniref:ABC transporter substrate-binding protein n=1 Tax=Bdellovibrio sp. HCB337 TaxID=3394358 RepID=UPI0039A61266